MFTQKNRERLEKNGCEIVKDLLDQNQIQSLKEFFGKMQHPGKRGLLENERILTFAKSVQIQGLMSEILEKEAKPVRAIFFDKSAEINWLVAWHQDLSIAVSDRIEVEGYGPWSVKEGVIHVRPPQEVLEQMLTIRIHLDRSHEENGSLMVIHGSHRQGKLSTDQIQAIRAKEAQTLCAADEGDALLMRPLLLHASSRSTSTDRRRVLHIEYAGCDLPEPLRWNAQG